MPDALANEWTELVEQWTSEEPRLRFDTLRARIEAERRRMWMWVAADVTVTVLFVAGAAHSAIRFPGAWTRLVAIDVGLMVAATWGFALWNRRGTWRPLGETTEAFLRLARLRCRRKLQALRFGTGLLVAQLLAVGAWALWGPRGAPFARSDALMALPVVVVVGFAAAIAWTRHRVGRELDELDRLTRLVSTDEA